MIGYLTMPFFKWGEAMGEKYMTGIKAYLLTNEKIVFTFLWRRNWIFHLPLTIWVWQREFWRLSVRKVRKTNEGYILTFV